MGTTSLFLPVILIAWTSADANRVVKPDRTVSQALESTTDQKREVQADPKAEIAKLRADLAKLRLELESALKEIKSLKEAIGQGASPKDQDPVYSGKPARFWLDQLKDGDPKFRVQAVEALGSLAEKDKKLIPVLVAALKDKDYYVRAEVPKALASLGSEVVPMLLVVLKDKTSPKAVEGAADAVRRIGPTAKAAIPLLSEALKMEDWGVRHSCVTALGQMGPDAKPAIPAMVDVLGVFLKTLENDAKQGKSMKIQVFGKGAFPSYFFEMLVKIDPEIRDILPNGTLRTKAGGPGINPMDQIALWQQAHAALKKKYDK